MKPKSLAKLYWLIRNIRGRKLLVGNIPIRIPYEMDHGWERSETEVALTFAEWIKANPSPLIIDLGASIGQFSTLALFADRSATVLALDSSLGSLAKLSAMTRYAGGSRLEIVWGFIVDKTSADRSLATAVAATHERLKEGEKISARMISLGDKDVSGIDDIPRYTMDGLFADLPRGDDRPILVKCDIEAAEVLMLRGAREFIRRCRPTFFLSVHSDEMLAAFGHTKDDVRTLLQEYGYAYTVISHDHEEHWLCEPID